MKFSGMMYIGLERLRIIFHVMVREIDDFLILRVLFCSDIFSETTQDIVFKFSQMIVNG